MVGSDQVREALIDVIAVPVTNAECDIKHVPVRLYVTRAIVSRGENSDPGYHGVHILRCALRIQYGDHRRDDSSGVGGGNNTGWQ